MSTTEPAPLSLESLQSQIILLQQQLATALADNLSPNYLTINDNGEVSADFSGVITAEGLTIPAYIGATGPEIPNQAQWIDPEGNQVGWIAGQQDASEAGVNYLRIASIGTRTGDESTVTIGSQDNAGNTFSLIATNTVPGGVSSVQASAGVYGIDIIDSNGGSNFVKTLTTGPWTIAFGESALTWDGTDDSELTYINHGIGRAPVAVTCTCLQAAAYASIPACNVFDINSVNFGVNGVTPGPVSGSQAFTWIAIG